MDDTSSGGGESGRPIGSILAEYEGAEVSAETRESVRIAEALFRAKMAGDEAAVAARTEELRERGVEISFGPSWDRGGGGQYPGDLWDEG